MVDFEKLYLNNEPCLAIFGIKRKPKRET